MSKLNDLPLPRTHDKLNQELDGIFSNLQKFASTQNIDLNIAFSLPEKAKSNNLILFLLALVSIIIIVIARHILNFSGIALYSLGVLLISMLFVYFMWFDIIRPIKTNYINYEEVIAKTKSNNKNTYQNIVFELANFSPESLAYTELLFSNLIEEIVEKRRNREKIGASLLPILSLLLVPVIIFLSYIYSITNQSLEANWFYSLVPIGTSLTAFLLIFLKFLFYLGGQRSVKFTIFCKRCLTIIKQAKVLTESLGKDRNTVDNNDNQTEQRKDQQVLMKNDEPIAIAQPDEEESTKQEKNERLFTELNEVLERMAAQSGMTRDELVDALDPSKPFPFEHEANN